VKAVFDVKQGSGYDDDITVRYRFPAKSDYLEVARSALGDWVLFREPRRNRGRQAYVATAKVISVEPDPADRKHYYAYVSEYMEFPRPVPFVTDGQYAEASLRAIGRPDRVGQSLQGKSMRPILKEDFDFIVLSGLNDVLASEDAVGLGFDFQGPELPPYAQPGLVTGLRIINGGGRAEVQAAHIKPVAAGGPDVVQNGIALSATVHWLFDRHFDFD
jgi:putative restriction endonuclease